MVEPISGKKLRVFSQARFFKRRHIFLRQKTAFARRIINIVHLFD
jgi:hypothetical protein